MNILSFISKLPKLKSTTPKKEKFKNSLLQFSFFMGKMRKMEDKEIKPIAHFSSHRTVQLLGLGLRHRAFSPVL